MMRMVRIPQEPPEEPKTMDGQKPMSTPPRPVSSHMDFKQRARAEALMEARTALSAYFLGRTANPSSHYLALLTVAHWIMTGTMLDLDPEEDVDVDGEDGPTEDGPECVGECLTQDEARNAKLAQIESDMIKHGRVGHDPGNGS